MKLLQHVRQDLPASIVVFLVALPLCMGVAIASGMPPAAGLITGIVGGILVGALAGAPLQVSGPAAGLTVLVWDIVRTHGVRALGPIVLCAGVFQIAAAWVGLGRWFRAVAPPVVYGMLAGIGVLIFASQFHVMMDDKPRGSGVENLLSIPAAIAKGIAPSPDTSHHEAAILGCLTIIVLVLWTKFRPERLKAVPAPLVGALAAVVAAAVVSAPVQYVAVPDDVWKSVSLPTLTELRSLAKLDTVLTAAALAMVATAETLLCAIAVDRMQDGERTNYDKELFSQGVGNVICGAVGALPMTGVIVRSSANVESGAKTRLSAMLHGVWLLALVTLFPGVLRTVPTASLAAILVYTGYKLVNPAHVRELRAFGRPSLAIYGVTVVTIVGVDLLTGVVTGLVLSAVRLLHGLTHLEVRIVPRPEDDRVDVYLGGAATFLRLPKLTRALERLPESGAVHFHTERLTYVDHAAIEAIKDWERQQESHGRNVVLPWEAIDGKSERVAQILSRPPPPRVSRRPSELSVPRGSREGDQVADVADAGRVRERPL